MQQRGSVAMPYPGAFVLPAVCGAVTSSCPPAPCVLLASACPFFLQMDYPKQVNTIMREWLKRPQASA